VYASYEIAVKRGRICLIVLLARGVAVHISDRARKPRRVRAERGKEKRMPRVVMGEGESN